MQAIAVRWNSLPSLGLSRLAPALALVVVRLADWGIRGIDPEPKAGYRLTKTRNIHLQAFSDAVWQRHEVHRPGHPGPLQQWPSSTAFHSNWPLLAQDLLVAEWKIAGAAAAELPLIEFGDIALLDPPAPPALDWHDTYALELAAAPGIASDLAAERLGDGIELVLERAQLSAGERAVMRTWLYNPDLETIAQDLGWRPQTVHTLYRNALDRLRWLGLNSEKKPQHRNVLSSGHADRARASHVPSLAGSRQRDHAHPRAG